MKLRWSLGAIIVLILINWIAFSTLSNGDDIQEPKITLQERGLISETWANIYWETDEHAIGGLEWGLTRQYGNIVNESGNYTTLHFINITGLTKDTDYYIRIFATDSSNNTGYFSFELGTHPRGLDTTQDYFWILPWFVIVIIVLIAIIIIIRRLRQKV